MKKILFFSIIAMLALSACDIGPGQAVYPAGTNCDKLMSCLQMHDDLTNEFNYLVFQNTGIIITPVNNNFFANYNKLTRKECGTRLSVCNTAVDYYVSLIEQFKLGNIQCSIGGTAPVILGCYKNSDCALGQICSSGNCVPEPNECEDGYKSLSEQCEEDNDCPAGLKCDNCLCVDCKVDADCPINNECKNNICVPKPAVPSRPPPGARSKSGFWQSG